LELSSRIPPIQVICGDFIVLKGGLSFFKTQRVLKKPKVSELSFFKTQRVLKKSKVSDISF